MKHTFQHLKVSTHPELNRVWTLEFDHGKANEVGTAVLSEIEMLVAALSEPDGPLGLISFSRRLSKKGTPIFIAGANVTERVGWTNDEVKSHVRYQRLVLSRLRSAPIFHVCLVSGVALGWGTEFLITADYKIALPSASFALPETGLGILPGAGGTSELQDLIGLAHTLRLGMTGERISADEATRIGLVQEIFDDFEAGFKRATALCALVSRKSPSALAAFKHAALDAVGKDHAERAEGEALAYEHCVDTGEAAVGRAAFDLIRKGGTPNWHPRALPDVAPETASD